MLREKGIAGGSKCWGEKRTHPHNEGRGGPGGRGEKESLLNKAKEGERGGASSAISQRRKEKRPLVHAGITKRFLRVEEKTLLSHLKGEEKNSWHTVS